ncbi:MAG: hypothetical protein KGJ90_00195 [Patescibacteria group bacterium]|nr:hypothetical protein [Patescibacteria group bacterium]
MEIEVEFEVTLKLRVTGTYHPYRSASYYGEMTPIDPPEPAGFEPDTIEVMVGDNKVIFPFNLLDEKQYMQLEELCCEEAEARIGYERDEAAERRMEERREERWNKSCLSG